MKFKGKKMDAEKMLQTSKKLIKLISMNHTDSEVINPRFLVFFGDKFIEYESSFSNDEEKHAFKTTACILMNIYGATGYTMINEAWALIGNAPDGLSEEELEQFKKQEVSKNPERIEILFISGENKTHFIMNSNQIHRDGDGRVTSFKELKMKDDDTFIFDKSKNNHMEGVFSNCLETAANIKTNEMIKTLFKMRFEGCIRTLISVDEQIASITN